MQPQRVARKLLVCGLVIVAAVWGRPAWAQGKTAAPPTVTQAKELLNLSEAPLMAGAKDPSQRTYSKLTYEIQNANPRDAFQFHRSQLVDDGWKEDAGSFGGMMGTFRRDGYVTSINAGMFQAGLTTVNVENHGNVNLAKLPVPAGAREFVTTPTSVTYRTAAAVEATKKALLKSMSGKGWQPYGEDKQGMYFKQNSVRLQMRVFPSEQAKAKGQTTIEAKSELLAYDLPALPDATELSYKDQTGQLTYNTKSKPAAVAEFYVKELTKGGWKSESKSLTKSDAGETMSFENDDEGTLTLLVTGDAGKTHVEVKQESPATEKTK